MTRRDVLAALACYWLVFCGLPAIFLLAAFARGWRPF